MQTDHCSLRHLLEHHVIQPNQQCGHPKSWVMTSIFYISKSNKVADGLSWRDNIDTLKLGALSWPYMIDFDSLAIDIRQDYVLCQIAHALQLNPTSRPHYSLINNLYYKGHLVLSANSPWIPKLLHEFHLTPIGGRFGFHATVDIITDQYREHEEVAGVRASQIRRDRRGRVGIGGV